MVVYRLSRGAKRVVGLVTSLYTLMTTRFSRRRPLPPLLPPGTPLVIPRIRALTVTRLLEGDMPDWARRILAAKQTTDLARDPTDPKVTRQSAATIQGVLVPVSNEDGYNLSDLFPTYQRAYQYYLQGNPGLHFNRLTATMEAMMRRAAARTKGRPPDFSYLSIDPRDYTVYTANHVDTPVISIHTRPERCWFLAVPNFVVDKDITVRKLGRMKVGKITDQGVYPITIRTNYRALTDKKKQEEVRDAYRRLIHE